MLAVVTEAGPSKQEPSRRRLRVFPSKIAQSKLPAEQQQQQPPQPQGAFKGALSAPLLSLPQRLARHALRWFGSRHPSVWLVLAVLAVHSRGRLDKRFDMRTFKNQVSSDEYHVTIVTTAALPWMTGTAGKSPIPSCHTQVVIPKLSYPHVAAHMSHSNFPHMITRMLLLIFSPTSEPSATCSAPSTRRQACHVVRAVAAPTRAEPRLPE